MKKLFSLILALLLLLTSATFAAAENGEKAATLLCLNIGKADCLLLSWGNTRWLIDTGYEATYPALQTALSEYQISHLNGVFLTHCHDDHSGGLLPLAQSNIAVDAWYASPLWFDVKKDKHPAVLAAAARGEEVTWLPTGTVLPVGEDATLTVLGPLETDEDNENNNSLVLLFSSPAGSILLCGDMKTDEEADLLSAGTLSACTLLKVGHHGDDGALSNTFLKAVRPEAAVISTSTAEEPDTPAPSTLMKLKSTGCATYVTQDYHDAILFTLSGGKVTAVEDIQWASAPPRVEGITLKIDVTADTATLRNTAEDPVSLNGYTLYSTKGDELLRLTGPTLRPGESWVIGSRSTTDSVDQTWDEKRVWSNKKQDYGILYDPWGRPVACADNGLAD